MSSPPKNPWGDADSIFTGTAHTGPCTAQDDSKLVKGFGVVPATGVARGSYLKCSVCGVTRKLIEEGNI